MPTQTCVNVRNSLIHNNINQEKIQASMSGKQDKQIVVYLLRNKLLIGLTSLKYARPKMPVTKEFLRHDVT